MIAARERADVTDADVLDRALSRLPEFDDVPRTVTPVTGGLTNRIYRVDAANGRSVVARLSSGKTSLLAIDRVAECFNADAAARAGAAPRVLLCDPDEHIAIIEWISGRAFSAEDLDDSGTLAKIALLCRRLHHGPRFVSDFDMVSVQRRYLDVVRSNGFAMPAGYLDFDAHASRIAAALASHPQPTVPCHNDLLAANIIDDGQRLWFIDFEYAGNNDPYFELGNVWAEADLAIERLEELVTAYRGTPSAALVARAWLYALLARYGWTLWAAIQAAVSEVDFDFWTWGLHKYERAVTDFAGPEFEHYLDQATHPE